MSASWKDNVRFVLASPRESGNIGATARAMKNMGFSHLSLVDAPDPLGDEAQWFARNAKDVLDGATRFTDIAPALQGAAIVIGTTRRKGRKRGVFLPIEDAAAKLKEIARTQPVALLFGGERKGLENEEVEHCNFLVSIPVGTATDQPSLNLAQAVLIVAYELVRTDRVRPLRKTTPELSQGTTPLLLATNDELAQLYERMGAVIEALGYTRRGDNNLHRKIMRLLRQFMGRSSLAQWELNMMIGLCSRIGEMLQKP